jgi:Putative  PD-(D/E)XK family member, (DUF4420)
MQIDDLWNALETDAAAGRAGKSGWLVRLARPAADCPLFVALELTSHRRAVLLRLPTATTPQRRLWPRSKGLEPLAVTIDGNAHFGVGLKESRFADVFTALTEDLVRRVTDAGDPSAQARVFLGQLARWKKFLSASFDGLTEECQRGLWGELRFLREQLLPALGMAAVNGWKGGERAHQDFQFGGGAVEVKTTIAKQPQIVRITSERQLDSSSWPLLVLNVVALEVREGGGETLPALVASLRSELTADPTAQEQFEDELLLSGYLDAHASRYSERGYIVRSETTFQVKSGFPRLVEKDLPKGVGDVKYGLVVAACAPFALKAPRLTSVLVRLDTVTKKRKERIDG